MILGFALLANAEEQPTLVEDKIEKIIAEAPEHEFSSEIQKQMDEIIKCESRYRHDGVWGSGGCYGIAQFKHQTFNNFKREAGRPELEWKNKEDQIWLLGWALENNYGNHWTCYKKRVSKKHRHPLK